jgi:hypothetical protein
VLLTDKDAQDLQDLEDSEEEEEDQAPQGSSRGGSWLAGGGGSSSGGSSGVGGGSGGSWLAGKRTPSASGAPSPFSGTRVVALERAVTLATIDNYQASSAKLTWPAEPCPVGMSSTFGWRGRARAPTPRPCPAHRLCPQGEENDIVLLSLVRNNKAGNIGFLKMQNRINVLLSRARHGLYILGNAQSLEANASKAPMWHRVLEILDSQALVGRALQVRVCAPGSAFSWSTSPFGLAWLGALGSSAAAAARPCAGSRAAPPEQPAARPLAPQLRCQNHPDTITDVREPEDFATLAGDGGCGRACSAELPCGHACPRRCHVDDPQHKHACCFQPCARLHAACGHACAKLCHEPCGDCGVVVPETQLPCDHVARNLRCWLAQRAAEEVRCRETVEVQVSGLAAAG